MLGFYGILGITSIIEFHSLIAISTSLESSPDHPLRATSRAVNGFGRLDLIRSANCKAASGSPSRAD